jgi:small ubiquitin-related modifier
MSDEPKSEGGGGGGETITIRVRDQVCMWRSIMELHKSISSEYLFLSRGRAVVVMLHWWYTIWILIIHSRSSCIHTSVYLVGIGRLSSRRVTHRHTHTLPIIRHVLYSLTLSTARPLTTTIIIIIYTCTKTGEETFFKIKKTTKMSKVFETYAQRKGVQATSLRFMLDGERVNEDETPKMLELEDQDQIDCMLEQTGGGCSLI